MNIDKAREHFSAYYEGSMDRGLRQTFERRLSEDAQIAAEYRAFEKMMGELEMLAEIPVSIPEDLHERISARVDRHVWDSKQSKPANSLFNWMRLGLVGVGVAAVAGLALMQSGSFNGGNDNVTRTDLLGRSQNINTSLDIKATEKGIQVAIPKGSLKLVIRSSDNEILDTVDLKANPVQTREVQNEGSSTRLISIDLDGRSSVWVAIPGTKRVDSSVVEGSMKDMARVIAGRFLAPVVLEVPNADQATRWSSSTESLMSAIEPARQNSEIKAEVTETPRPILKISQG